MSKWTAPSALNVMKPRPVGVKPSQKRAMLFTWIALAFMPALLAIMAAHQLYDIAILKSRGEAAAAAVTRLYVTHGKGGPIYNVDYQFMPGAATAAVERHLAVGQQTYDRMRVGQDVPVIYDPRDPALSRPNITDAIHRESALTFAMHEGVFSVYLIIIALSGFFSALTIILYRRSLRRQTDLLSLGDTAPATILSEREYSTKAGRKSTVRYSFVDRQGMTVEGKQANVPAASDMRGDMAAYRAENFRNPTVLFDPEQSGRNLLYPPSMVELQGRGP